MLTTVVIPYRDRGTDPLRAENLACVVSHWEELGFLPRVVSDGREGTKQFNRSAAYNRGVRSAGADTDVFIFAEADMLIPDPQITEAEAMALKAPGLVVPFDTYHYLGPHQSQHVRRGLDPTELEPQYKMQHGSSIGAINVVSRETMDLVGQFDERFEGCWFDDDAMKIAFEELAGPTRWVQGRAFHLYHLPGFKGDHLTDEDMAATAANQARYRRYKAAKLMPQDKTVQRIRTLVAGGQ